MNSLSPLHVTIVSTQERWHGGEQQAALLAEGIQRRGLRCSILCRADSEFERRMRGDFDVHTFPSRGRSPLAIYRIRHILKELQPDVLHANDAHALTSVGIAGIGLRIPVRVAARRVDFPLRWTARYKRLSNGLICVSNAVASICATSGIPESHLHVVHDGVDPAFAESGSRIAGRQSLQLSDDEPLLLTVAKLTDHKGHRYLLQAIPAILSARPRAVLAIAGDGELHDELVSMARDLGIQDHVRFLGYRNDVADLLAAADVVVQPSHMEGLCSSLIDAMLAARPIVATRAGGIPDLLESCVNEHPVAWLVATKCAESIGDAVNAALSDKTASNRKGELARERALQRFTADKMVEATLSVYAKIARDVSVGDQAAFESSVLAKLPERSAA